MRRTGVVLGVEHMSLEAFNAIREQLAHTFPGVRFAIVAGAASVAFEYDDETEDDA